MKIWSPLHGDMQGLHIKRKCNPRGKVPRKTRAKFLVG
jgi:hypothetical protein